MVSTQVSTTRLRRLRAPKVKWSNESIEGTISRRHLAHGPCADCRRLAGVKGVLDESIDPAVEVPGLAKALEDL